MEFVQKGCSVKRAAEVHEVPRKPLQDRVLDRGGSRDFAE